MDFYLVVYSSVTLANRIKKCVSQDGAYIGVIHTPSSISLGGCSYALRFKGNKLQMIKKISSDCNIKIKGIYKEIKKNGVNTYEKIG